MNNSLLRPLMAALIAVAGLAAVHSVASAQPYRYTCIFVNGVKIVVVSNTNTAGPSTGSGSFVPTTPPPPPGQPFNVSYQPTQINVTASDPANGTISTQLNPAAPQPATTFVSNGAAPFPATGSISFNAEARIEGRSDRFTSNSPLEFRNDHVNSLPPFAEPTTFTLATDVTFTSENGSSTFTLKAGQTSVTLGGGNEGQGR